MKRYLPILFIIGTILFQCALLVYPMQAYQTHVNKRHEVILKVRNRDPRDFYRGHYAWLRYDIENIPDIEITSDKVSSEKRPIFGKLVLGQDGYCSVENWQWSPPSDSSPFIRANSKRCYPRCRASLGGIVSINENGVPLIKGIYVEGHKFYEEPLF